MRRSLRDRFFTPGVARAMMSPLGIVLAGAGAAAGILSGLGPLAAVAGGVLAWGTRVGFAVPRNEGRPDIEPRRLGQPWREHVERALASQRRFSASLARARGGPITSRLGEISAQIEAGVHEAWELAQRGAALGEARSSVPVADIARQLSETRQWAASPQVPAETRATYESTIEALEAQLATARRIEDVMGQADAKLRLLDARLAETATRAVELSARSDDVGELGGLGEGIGEVVHEMEALRQALDEVERPGRALEA